MFWFCQLLQAPSKPAGRSAVDRPLVPADDPNADPPGEPAEKKAAEDVQRIVNMLNKQQDRNAESYQQGKPSITPAGEAEVQQEHGRRMARKEQVFCDKPVMPIEEVAQGIRKSDQAGRRIQGYEGDGQGPEDA